jgi:hypothetical protein
LGQGAPALNDLPCFQVRCESGPDSPEIQTVVLKKPLILYGQECGDEMVRDLLKADGNSIATLPFSDSADQLRLEGGLGKSLPILILDSGDPA